jgi:D-alanyl-D-alanine carboxypeptidase
MAAATGLALIATPAMAGRHAALVVDGNTGRVMSENAADEPRYPASLTKMMTLYMVFDLIEQGKLSYNTRITFSQAATRVQPTKLGVEVGGSITVLDVIKALITKSANDAAVAVAEHIAGSEPKFAALMTQKARQIGMKGSTFKNAHGLPDSEQVTTARDMVTLGLRLQDDFPQHYGLFATREFRHNGDTHRNHNTLLFSYEGTDGIKTGYIGSSGFNLVANVRRNQKHIIGVVFGGPSAAARNQTMRNLLNLALVKGSATKTRAVTPYAKGRQMPPASVPVPMAAARTAPIVVAAATPPPATPTPRPAPPPRDLEAAPATTPESNIKLAKVRPLLVAPRAPQQAPLPRVMVAAAPEPVEIAPPPLAQTAAPIRSVAPQPPVLPAVQSAPQRGAPPSTFQQQAANLTRGIDAAQPASSAPAPRPQYAQVGLGSQPAYRLNGPTPAAPQAPAAGALQIQVGAYATRADAERQLASVREKAADLVAPYQSAAVEAQSQGRPIFRARYVGLDQASAGKICNDLRRRQIDCMVAKAE